MAGVALARFRGGISGLLNTAAAGSVQAQQKCSIVSKALRDPDHKKPKPWPYESKQYRFFEALFDGVSHRFDENSKIIVVDGPPTGDKTQFAKEVAAELDMLHIPPANLDAIFINEYGYDLRQLNPKLPKSTRSFDIEEFLQNPKHSRVAKMQLNIQNIRFDDYLKAMAHVLNTGQGVVMNRCIYSDRVFVETMHKHGFFSDLALRYYNESLTAGMWEFLRPHLVIYLDIPVDKVISNVKARGRPHEQNSPFYTPEILKTLEDNYKKEYLKTISKHAEVLVYDWTEGGEAEVVVEDICRLDLEKYSVYDTQMKDWRFKDEWEMKTKRIMMTSDFFKSQQKDWVNIPRFYCEEILTPGADYLEYTKVLEESPGGKYRPGYNSDMGDQVLFKN